MRLIWATDIHLDFITDEDEIRSNKNLDTFCSQFDSKLADAVIISGDISTGHVLINHLSKIERRIDLPIYFVLGNHDFWGRSFSLRQNIAHLCMSSERLNYLSSLDYIRLNDSTFLAGHDGWYDGLYGNPSTESFVMNDWTQILDFQETNFFGSYSLNSILSICRKEALLATQHVANSIKSILSRYKAKKIVIVTHVPPFKEHVDSTRGPKKSLYPWYASKTMGDMLLSAAKNNPSVKFEIFCGHVHSRHDEQILSNLTCRSGHAEYFDPLPQGIFEV